MTIRALKEIRNKDRLDAIVTMKAKVMTSN